MKKDIILDGLQKTTYMKDDMEGKIAVKNVKKRIFFFICIIGSVFYIY